MWRCSRALSVLLSVVVFCSVSSAQPCGQTSTVAGQNTIAGVADGSGTAAQFNNPYEVIFGQGVQSSLLYIFEQQGCRLRVLNVSSGAVSSLAGSLANVAGEIDGVGSDARFWNPDGAALDGTLGAAGTLYATTQLGTRLRRVDIATATVTSVVGSAAGSNADGIGTAASVNTIRGAAVNANMLYFTAFSQC